MKTNAELKQLAMQEANAEQKRIEQLYVRLKSRFEREAKEYVDAKVKQLVADAEEIVKEYYQGKRSGDRISEFQTTGLLYSEQGILFAKKHYYYRCRDLAYIQFQKADAWEKFYNVRYDDDNHQIHEFNLLDSDEPKKIKHRKYNQYVMDELKKNNFTNM